jgi:chromosomal replication initiation ATPase DnaA
MNDVPSNEELLKKYLKQKDQHRKNQSAYIKRRQVKLEGLEGKVESLEYRYANLLENNKELEARIDKLMANQKLTKEHLSIIEKYNERLKRLENENELNVSTIREIVDIMNDGEYEEDEVVKEYNKVKNHPRYK